MSTMTIEQIDRDEAAELLGHGPAWIPGIEIEAPNGNIGTVWLCGRVTGATATGCIATAVWGRDEDGHVYYGGHSDWAPTVVGSVSWTRVLSTDPSAGDRCDSCREAGYTTVYAGTTAGWLSDAMGLEKLTVYTVGEDGGTTTSDIPVTVELLEASAGAGPEGMVAVDGDGNVLDPSEEGQPWVPQPVRTVWVGR